MRLQKRTFERKADNSYTSQMDSDEIQAHLASAMKKILFGEFYFRINEGNNTCIDGWAVFSDQEVEAFTAVWES